MAHETPVAPEGAEIGPILRWLHLQAPSVRTDDVVATALATGLFYEAQAHFAALSTDAELDFYSEAMDRSFGETGLQWAERTARGLTDQLDGPAVSQLFTRAAQRALDLLTDPALLGEPRPHP